MSGNITWLLLIMQYLILQRVAVGLLPLGKLWKCVRAECGASTVPAGAAASGTVTDPRASLRAVGRRRLNNSLRVPFYGVFAKKAGVILSLCIMTCCWRHEIFHGRRQRKFFT